MSEPRGRCQFTALALAPSALEARNLLPSLAAPAITPPRESVLAALPRMMEVAGTPVNSATGHDHAAWLWL